MLRLVPLAALLLLGALIAPACGGDDDAGGTQSFPTTTDPAKPLEGKVRKINAVVAGSDWVAGDNNFVFGITDEKDEPIGGAKAKATFFDLRDSRNPKPLFSVDAVESAPGVGKVVEHKHAGGEVHKHGGQEDNRVGYYARAGFTYAGLWGVSVEATLKDGTRGVSNVAFQVADKTVLPLPGQKAKPSDNLTRRDVADIKEIDSGDPPNDMHDVKIKDAIAAGRPVMVVFSTPLYCSSRFCGPVNEEVEALREVYKDRVDFVHIEIWRNFDKKELNPTAKEWLQRPDGGLSEPWVYLVDKGGVIYDRWEGPVARGILEPAVKMVAEGKTYGQR